MKKKKRLRGTTSIPCPKCHAKTRVLRTSLGTPVRRTAKHFVLRERVCISPAHHRFHTEEKAK